MGPPRVVRLFLAIELAQGALLLALNHSRVVPAGVAFELLLLWRLYRGSALCWLLLLAENLFMALAALALIASGFQGVLWGNAAALVIPCLAQAALLLTRQMRVHVGIGRAGVGPRRVR